MFLKDELSKRVNLSDILRIVNYTKQDSEGKQQLYELLDNKDFRTVINTLWVMTHCSEEDNIYLDQKQTDLIDRVLVSKNTTQVRHFLTILAKQEIKEPTRVDFLDFCIDEIIKREKQPATTALCMKLAYKMCENTPELLNELMVALELLEQPLPPSIISVKKRIIRGISKRR